MQRRYKKQDNATIAVSDTYDSLQVFTTLKITYNRGRIRTNIVDIYKVFLN